MLLTKSLSPNFDINFHYYPEIFTKKVTVWYLFLNLLRYLMSLFIG